MAYLEAVVPFSVALVQTPDESSTLAFVGDRPSSFVVSSPLKKAFEPFFAQAEERLDRGLSAYVRWSQKRSYAARLLHAGISSTDSRALKLLAERSTETLPSRTTAALLDALVDPSRRRSFKDRLARSVAGYADRLRRDSDKVRNQRLAVSAAVFLLSVGAGVAVLAGIPVPWTLDTNTPIGTYVWLLGLVGLVWLGVEAAHLHMAVAHLHERESARLDASIDPGRFEGWHHLQRGSALAASISLAAAGVFFATEMRRVATYVPERVIAATDVPSVELEPSDPDTSAAEAADLLPPGFVPPDLTDRVSDYQVRQVMPAGVVFQCSSATDGVVRAFGVARSGPDWVLPAQLGMPETRVSSYEAAVQQVCSASAPPPVTEDVASETVAPWVTLAPLQSDVAPAMPEPPGIDPASLAPRPPEAPSSAGTAAPRELPEVY